MSQCAGTIVMIHGMWGGGWYWKNYVDFFEARGFRCITPTLRYHNADPGSPPHPHLGTLSLRDYVADLEKELTDLSEPILMGHSMGGLLAQILASRVQAKALVLISPASPAGIVALSPSVIRAFISFFLRWKFWAKPHRQTFDEAAYSVLNLLPIEQQREIHSKYVFESGRATAEIGLWPLDFSMASAVDESKITCPVLTVVGSQDRIIPPFSVRKVAAKYGATHREFPDNAHWIIGEPGWDDVATYIMGWLSGPSF